MFREIKLSPEESVVVEGIVPLCVCTVRPQV